MWIELSWQTKRHDLDDEIGLLSSPKKRGIVTSAATNFRRERECRGGGTALWHSTNNKRGTGDYGGAEKGLEGFVCVINLI